jgi:protoheme IX farnesyltransferase
MLTKPGIIIGNLITAAGGFLFASHGDVDPVSMVGVLLGTTLVIASGCVFNNYIDRGIDAKMIRTKKRALVTGVVRTSHALGYATVLGALGFLTLIILTNALTVGVGVLGYFFYLGMYSFWKRRSTLGTVVGSIAGAAPILAGYVAASNDLDSAGILLFAIMALWQMPHFFAIAMYRHTDYAAAGLPVMPVQKGNPLTKQYIVLYIVAFTGAVCALTTLGYAGITYLGVMSVLCLAWLLKAIKGLESTDDTAWARDMFKLSLRVITAFSVMISIDALLP